MLSGNQARDLGEGLRRLRLRKQLTRFQAANVCGLPHLVYARLEQGWMPGDAEETALMRAWGELQVYRHATDRTSATSGAPRTSALVKHAVAPSFSRT